MRILTLVAACFAPVLASAFAQAVPVRYPQGTTHGFLVLRTLDGKTIALGDLEQQLHRRQVESRLTFRFRDGSIDDDRAVFTQAGSFHLLREHHLQHGPSFPKPIDIAVDFPHSIVTTREEQPGGGAPKITTEHMDLPPELANGMLLTMMENLRPDGPASTLALVVSYHGARLIHLDVTPQGTIPFHVGGVRKQARDFLVKIRLGGVTGMVAPIIGKQPSDCHFWFLEGGAPIFVREEGQLFQDGPVWRIEQSAPAIP